MTPTQSVLKHYRQQGFTAEVVEKWIPVSETIHPEPGKRNWGKGGGFRKDLFGFGDILIMNSGKKITALVQACTRGDMANRKNKILTEKKAVEWLACGNKIYLCGLAKREHKGKRVYYELVEEEIRI